MVPPLLELLFSISHFPHNPSISIIINCGPMSGKEKVGKEKEDDSTDDDHPVLRAAAKMRSKCGYCGHGPYKLRPMGNHWERCLWKFMHDLGPEKGQSTYDKRVRSLKGRSNRYQTNEKGKVASCRARAKRKFERTNESFGGFVWKICLKYFVHVIGLLYIFCFCVYG
jgi:hypothetical protein